MKQRKQKKLSKLRITKAYRVVFILKKIYISSFTVFFRYPYQDKKSKFILRKLVVHNPIPVQGFNKSIDEASMNQANSQQDHIDGKQNTTLEAVPALARISSEFRRVSQAIQEVQDQVDALIACLQNGRHP